MKNLTAAALSIALATSATGCGGKQLTNRQLAIGIGAAAAVVLVIYLLSTQCDETDFNDCSFK